MSQRIIPALLVTALALIEVLLLWQYFKPEFLNPDSAQIVSAAENFMDGRGLRTSALYYEEQQALGQPPVPLTVWPPGFAATMLPFLAIGFSGVTAAFLASAAGLLLTAVLTFLTGIQAGLGRGLSLVAALACLLFTSNAMIVTLAMSDMLYVAMTLASALMLLKSVDEPTPGRWLALAGACGAAAFSIRYSGVTWLAAAGIFVLAMNFRAGLYRLFLRCLAFGLIPLAVVVSLLGRNFALTGSLTGGPAVGGETTALSAVRASFHALARMFGAGERPWDLLFGAIALCGIACVLMILLRSVTARDSTNGASEVAPSDRLLVIFVLYAIFTGSLILAISFLLYTDAAQPRYFAPLLPFIALAVAASYARFIRRSYTIARPAPSIVLKASGIALLVMYSLGQYSNASKDLPALASHHRVAMYRAISAAKVAPSTLTQYLRSHVTTRSPLVTADGQVLTGLLGIATLSQPEPIYSSTIWDESRTRTLMARFSSCLILVYRPSLSAPGNEQRVFLKQLAEGTIPGWLTSVLDEGDVALFRMVGCTEAR